MIDDNSKKLGKIFALVLIIIGIIILLYLIGHTLSVNNYDYELPTTTTEYNDKEMTNLTDAEKINYNTLLNDGNFLRGINNSVDYSNKDINIFENEENIFKYVYSKNSKDGITLEELNTLTNEAFNVQLSKENLESYYDGSLYKYEINYADPKYCIKAVNEKDEEKQKTVYFEMIDYNSESCKADILDYDKNLVALKGTLVLSKGDNKYFINSMMIK